MASAANMYEDVSVSALNTWETSYGAILPGFSGCIHDSLVRPKTEVIH